MNDLEKALNVCNAINNDLADIVNNHDLMAIVAKTLSDKGDASIRQLLKFTADGLPISDPEKESLSFNLELERVANKKLSKDFEECFNHLSNIYDLIAHDYAPSPKLKDELRQYVGSNRARLNGKKTVETIVDLLTGDKN